MLYQLKITHRVILKDNNRYLLIKVKSYQKNIIFENNYWKISGAHDGYLIKFGTNYEEVSFILNK